MLLEDRQNVQTQQLLDQQENELDVANEKLNQESLELAKEMEGLTCQENMIEKHHRNKTSNVSQIKGKCDSKCTTKDNRAKLGQKASRTENVGASVMRIDQIKRKVEHCSRHVPQLLVRGEHVGSIVLLS